MPVIGTKSDSRGDPRKEIYEKDKGEMSRI